MNKLVIASHNAGKVREFSTLLAPFAMEAVSAGTLGISEPEETGATFAENAALKALHCANAANLPALSDDSGLAIPALGGAPGIYSARWAGPNKDFSVAFARIQKELAEKNTLQPIASYFICNLCLAFPSGEITHFEGRIDGTLTFPPRGEHGFGYDPIFIPNGYDVTFAEIDSELKNRISHRARAFELFVEYLKSYAA